MTKRLLIFAFVCTVFGTTFAMIAVGLRDGWPPFFAAGLRFTLAGLLVLGVAAATRQMRRVTARDFAVIAFVAATTTVMVFGVLYKAEQIIPSGFAALLSATSPVAAFGIAVGRGTRRVSPSAVFGLMLGTAGVALVVGLNGRLGGAPALLAALALLASEIAYAAGLSAVRAVDARVPLVQIAGLQQLLGGLALLALAALTEHRLPAHVDAAGIGALLYLAVVASAGAHTAATWLAGVTDATFASSWTYVSPFIAVAVGAVALHEPLGLPALAGAVLVVAGCVLLNATFVRARGRGRAVA